MSTVIYPSPIFGPIHSRRLGVSLGINLMPADGKICSFDCIYCECGFNAERRPTLPRPTRAEVSNALEQRLKQMQAEGTAPDVLTFAGNGEPTLHPDFADIIGDTIGLRDSYFPTARISVLTNSTAAHRPDIHDALMRVDNNIMKLDTVCPTYIALANRPAGRYHVDRVIETMRSFGSHAVIQTMFMKGSYNGIDMDNTTERYVAPWLEKVKYIAPREVMIYTIDRETPDHDLRKATPAELNTIRDRVIAAGIPCTAAY